MDASKSIETSTTAPLHRWLLALFAFGVVGIGTELGLLGHYEDYKQYVPLILLTLGLAGALWLAMAPSRRSLLLFRWLMVGFVVGGLTGLVLHYRTNVEFELELYPATSGWHLFWESIHGATPALAPGTMIQLGLLGMLATVRHPAAGRLGRLLQDSTKPPSGDDR